MLSVPATYTILGFGTSLSVLSYLTMTRFVFKSTDRKFDLSVLIAVLGVILVVTVGLVWMQRTNLGVLYSIYVKNIS